MLNPHEIDDFVDQVQWVSKEVQAILNGKIDIQKSIENQQRKKLKIRMQEQAKQKAQQQLLLRGTPGRGDKFDTFEGFCMYCFRQFKKFRENCGVCGRTCITSQQRKSDLMEKVEKMKKQRQIRAQNKVKWENWKKTQAMLYKKTATNYTKWDYFVDQDQQQEKLDFVPPDDPNFKAMQQDMKQRAKKRKVDFQIAEKLKEQGNAYFKQGKFRNALIKYQQAQDTKRDYMILYTNSAIARIKIQDFQGAVKDCTRVLQYHQVFQDGYEKSKDVCFKALIRRGEAYRHLNRFKEAVGDFTTALDLKPDQSVQKLLQRTQQQASNHSEPQQVIEISDSAQILSELDSHQKILGFIHSNGCLVLIKRVLQQKDEQALKVLQFVFKDQNNYSYLRPLIIKVYNKRRIGMSVLLDAVKKYLSDQEFVCRILYIVQLSLENTHIRQEAVKHSAGTKGKKICVLVFQLFLESEGETVKSLISVLSNLCMSKFKSAYERQPNPGNIKAVIRYSWEAFFNKFLSIYQDFTTQALGLICNLSSEPKLKKLFLQTPEIVTSIISTAIDSDKSIPVQRALGFLINSCTLPSSIEDLQQYFQGILAVVFRVIRLQQTTRDIKYRGHLLLFRLLLAKPEFADRLVGNQAILNLVFKSLSDLTDLTVKIITAGCASRGFCRVVPREKIMNLAIVGAKQLLDGEKLEERVGNLALSIGKIAAAVPEVAHEFKEVIEVFIQVVKECLGPVRKNTAVCLGKLAGCQENKEELRRVHGIEVLQSVMSHLNTQIII